MKTFLLPWLAAAALGATAAHAADIYRWVDDAGKTQFSDTVPERYRARATRIDSSAYELSPAQRAIAEARARQAASAPPAAPPGGRPVPLTGTGGAPAASLGAASQAGADTRDCASWQRRYAESQECFAPYKLVNGGTKPEGYQKCVEVPDPASQCGIPRAP